MRGVKKVLGLVFGEIIDAVHWHPRAFSVVLTIDTLQLAIRQYCEKAIAFL